MGEERARLGIPQDFDSLLPMGRMALLSDTWAEVDTMGDFIRPGFPCQLRAVGGGISPMRLVGY